MSVHKAPKHLRPHAFTDAHQTLGESATKLSQLANRIDGAGRNPETAGVEVGNVKGELAAVVANLEAVRDALNE